MTESECLVFTMYTVILVSLIDKTHKNIRLPYFLTNSNKSKFPQIHLSLNVMINGVPFIIVAT